MNNKKQKFYENIDNALLNLRTSRLLISQAIRDFMLETIKEEEHEVILSVGTGESYIFGKEAYDTANYLNTIDSCINELTSISKKLKKDCEK